jgi:thioredoxin-like negative regulator of GroEL
MAVGLAIAGGRWSNPIPRAWFIGVVLISTIGSIRVINRVGAFESDETLWAAERAVEPNNPYAAGGLARAWVGTGRYREAVELWAWAADQARPGIRVFDKANERWLLAQTAFLKQAPDVALDQVTKLIHESTTNGSTAPAMAHCLVADSLDALGRHDEAASASVHCAP